MRRLVQLFAMALASAGAVSAAPEVAAAGTVPSRCEVLDPFTPQLERQLAATWPGNRFTASVYDARTGCQYDLHPDARLTTASMVKIELMAAVLLRAQDQGRGLTAGERALIEPMISESANPPASQLFGSLGGAAGVRRLGDRFGLTATVPVEPRWGLTTTSARDQVHLLRQVVLGEFGPLGSAGRAEAIGAMSRVVPSQRWGITSGVPAGWAVVQKNGFASAEGLGWRINSAGVVFDPAGGSYALAILSDGWPTEAAGIAAVETVNRAIAGVLARSFTIPTFHLRDTHSSPVAGRTFAFGGPGDAPIVGDWDGDGDDTAGVIRRGNFLLSNATVPGVADVAFAYGDPNDEVVVGDWDGDGRDSVGVRRGNRFLLRNATTSGVAETTFTFGDPGDDVVVGDWDGDGYDTVGVVRGGRWFVRNANTSGVADLAFGFGDPGDRPIAGDWDGDGDDTPGVHRGSRFFLANSAGGLADVVATYGDPGDEAVVGDGNGDGIDTTGVTRSRG